MKILGIIPARGGSKGVIRKNIRHVGGKPLIEWSIDSALSSKKITRFYVSTDDDEIRVIANNKGADVLLRASELAADDTPMIPVLQKVVIDAEKLHGVFDYIILLQPTAPMRTSDDIDNAIDIICNEDIDSLISVYMVEDCHPSRMYKLSNGYLKSIYNEPDGSLRQDLEPIFHRNGAIYLCKRNLLMNDSRIICDTPTPYIMKKENSVNIDDEQDLSVANFLMSKK